MQGYVPVHVGPTQSCHILLWATLYGKKFWVHLPARFFCSFFLPLKIYMFTPVYIQYLCMSYHLYGLKIQCLLYKMWQSCEG